jgi:hypothetical protein
MVDSLKEMIGSKKWLAVFAAIVIGVLMQYGVINETLAIWIASALGVGVAGQSVTDHGKSAAEINSNLVTKTGIATSPGKIVETTEVKPGNQGGHMTTLILLILIFFAGCGPALHSTGSTSADCGKEAVRQVAGQLVPTLETIAVTDSDTKKAQMDTLVKFGESQAIGAGFCAARAAINELVSRLGSTGAEGQESVGIANLRGYLADQKVSFAQ